MNLDEIIFQVIGVKKKAKAKKVLKKKAKSSKMIKRI